MKTMQSPPDGKKKYYKVITSNTTKERREGNVTRNTVLSDKKDGSFTTTTGKSFDANVTKVKEISPKKAARLDAKASKLASKMDGGKETGDAKYTQSVMDKTAKKTGEAVTSMNAFKAQSVSNNPAKKRKVKYVASAGGEQPKRTPAISPIKGPAIKTPKLVTEASIAEKKSAAATPPAVKKKQSAPATKPTGGKTYTVKRKVAPSGSVKKTPGKSTVKKPTYTASFRARFE